MQKKSKNFGTLMTKTSPSKVKVQKNSTKAIVSPHGDKSKGKVKNVKLVGNNSKSVGTKLVTPRVGAKAVTKPSAMRKPAKMAMKNIPVKGKKSVSLALGKK